MPDFTKDAVDDYFQALFTRFTTSISNVATFWPQFSTKVDVTTETAIHRWVNTVPSVREWLGARVVQNISTSGFTVTNRHWESLLGLSVIDWKNDNHSLYGNLIDMQAASAGRHKDRLAADLIKDNTALAFDDLTLFNDAHPAPGGTGTFGNQDTGGGGNYWYVWDSTQSLQMVLMQDREDFTFQSITDPQSEHVIFHKEFLWGAEAQYNAVPGFPQNCYRSNQILNEANLDAVLVAMAGFKDSNGDPLGLNPDTIMVGPSNRLPANKLLNTQFDAAGATNASMNAVPNIIVNPYLP